MKKGYLGLEFHGSSVLTDIEMDEVYHFENIHKMEVDERGRLVAHNLRASWSVIGFSGRSVAYGCFNVDTLAR